MEKDDDKWLSRGIILAVIGAVISAIATAIFVPGVFSWLWGVVVLIWRFFTAPVGIPVWLLSLLLFIIVWLVYRGLKRSLRSLATPSYLTYTDDRFFGIHWRWKYLGNQLDNPKAYCPECDTLLSIEAAYGMPTGLVTRDYTFQTIFYCEHCNWRSKNLDGQYEEIEAKVIRQIDRKIRNNEWARQLEKS